MVRLKNFLHGISCCSQSDVWQSFHLNMLKSPRDSMKTTPDEILMFPDQFVPRSNPLKFNFRFEPRASSHGALYIYIVLHARALLTFTIIKAQVARFNGISWKLLKPTTYAINFRFEVQQLLFWFLDTRFFIRNLVEFLVLDFFFNFLQILVLKLS